MTTREIADPVPASRRINGDTPGDVLGFLYRTLRPSDGWLSLTFLSLNLVVVVLSVEQADWVPTPSMPGTLLLAMLTALALYRMPVWPGVTFLFGLAIGLGVVIWQMSTYQVDEQALEGVEELWARLRLWFDATQAGTINIGKVPFAFGLTIASWLTGFLGGWLFLRYRNFWGVFLLGGFGLFANLTFLPPNTSLFLAIYLFTALLLVARVQSVRRRNEWRERNVTFDEHLGSLTFSDSFFLTVAVVVIAFLLPAGGRLGPPATDAYESMRTPLATWEDDFNRLFAGLPARRPVGFRIWDDVMAFQGSINPTTTQVLRVESPLKMYWKARTYNTYTSKGWISEDTVFEPLGFSPEFASPEIEQDRVQVSYIVTPFYPSRSLFSGDRVIDVDRDVKIETQTPSIYEVDVSDPGALAGFPGTLAQAGQDLRGAVLETGGAIDDQQLANLLPAGLRLEGVERDRGVVESLTLSEALPFPADVLSVRRPSGKFEAGKPYQVTSAVSFASPDQLRNSNGRYPAYVLERYTKLPDSVPDRVHALAADLTEGARTPYDKAKAIEDYLRTLPYTLDFEPPAFDADGVDHFLFIQKQGYSEYFASSMAVMLRSQGVPTRLAVGYTSGDEVGSELFAVTDSHSHAWVEVYMPGFSWIPFEPTPGKQLPAVYLQGVGSLEQPNQLDISGSVIEPDCLDAFLEGCDEFEAPAVDAATGDPGGGGIGSSVRDFLPWLLITLAALVGVGLSVYWFWNRYMALSFQPQVVFRRMAGLAKLSAIGPEPYQTPYQFGARLDSALPAQGRQMRVVVDSYVRNRYGQKELSEQEEGRLAEAWSSVRFPLLRRTFFRRGL